MLPFLKNKDRQNGMVSHRYVGPEGAVSSERNSDNSDGMEAAAKDVLNAIQANDHKRLAEALHAAFQIYDAMPHVEYDHSKEGSVVE